MQSTNNHLQISLITSSLIAYFAHALRELMFKGQAFGPYTVEQINIWERL